MDPIIAGIALLIIVSILLGALGVRAALTRESTLVLDRMQRVVQTQSSAQTVALTNDDARQTPWGQLLSVLARLSKPKENSDEHSKFKMRLSYAGYRGAHVTEFFFGAKLALALLLSGGLALFASMSVEPINNAQMWVIIFAAIGFYTPNVWLNSRATARQTALSRSLPDTLDLLVTCVEAGLGLDQALARITQEIGASAPELSFELQQTTSEIRMGMTRTDGFRRLAERTGLEELRALSAMLIQTEMFGTSVSKALRVHSGSMRVRRSHRAEERGATVAVKMLLPLIFCILPSLFSIILGPAAVRIVKTLLPTMGAVQ